jgi:hypothetical protein
MKSYLFFSIFFIAQQAWVQVSSSSKKCVADRTYEKTTLIRAARLYHGCDTKVKIKTKDKTVQIPSGKRVMRIDDSENSQIYFYHDGKIQMGELIPQESLTVSRCPQNPQGVSAQAFIDEAHFTITMLSKFPPQSNTFFNEELVKLSQKIETLMKDPDFKDSFLIDIANNWREEQILYSARGRVARLQHYFDVITRSYNPIMDQNKLMSKTTLVVPLSHQWFQSNDKLKKFYQDVWMNSGKDIRILAGSSGEGVIKQLESFLEMKDLILKTRDFIKKKAPELGSSAEAQWLFQQSSKNIDEAARMIFIHPKTWEFDSKENLWADFIAVDQNIGGIPSDYLLSVLIHEINVNSSHFLIYDTHSMYSKNVAMWECIRSNGISELDQADGLALQQAFGLNAQLSFVYLKILTDRIFNKHSQLKKLGPINPKKYERD